MRTYFETMLNTTVFAGYLFVFHNIYIYIYIYILSGDSMATYCVGEAGDHPGHPEMNGGVLMIIQMISITQSITLMLYMHIHTYMYICKYIYIYIYTHAYNDAVCCGLPSEAGSRALRGQWEG